MFYDERENQPVYESKPVKTTAVYATSPTIESIFIPAARSIFLGFTLAATAALLSYAFSWPFDWSPWLVFGVVWFGVMSVSFLSYTRVSIDFVERLTGVDLNGDTQVGAPGSQLPALPEPPSMRIEVISEGGARGDYLNLPISTEKMRALASGLSAGRSFNQTAWCGGGALLSRSQYDRIRDRLIEAGLARWRNPEAKSQGVTLTASGRAVMRKLAGLPTSPTERE